MVFQWSMLATVNAVLNALTFVLLINGYVAIKRKQERKHELLMKAAGIMSALFLASYLTYHYMAGHVAFKGVGWIKTAYLLMLFSHIVLAVVNAVLALMTFWYAHKKNWTKHKRIAKITFPIWVYVSVTGVLIYVMVYHMYP